MNLAINDREPLMTPLNLHPQHFFSPSSPTFCLRKLASRCDTKTMDCVSRSERGTEIDDLQCSVLQGTLKEVAKRNELTTECCVVCLEGISEPCELVPCGHYNFDYLCLMHWLFGSPFCPLCKAPASKVLHGPTDSRKITHITPKLKPRLSPPLRGRIFSGRGINGQFVPESLRSRQFHRRRQERTSAERDSSTAATAAARRREVYIHKRFSKHVGANRVSRFRELTPAMFCTDEELVARARMWIRRELQVFSFLTLDESETDTIDRPTDPQTRTAAERRRANNAEFLLEYIIAILKSVDIMGSAGQAEDMLSDFLGRENTRLFWHELRAWLRSPFTKLEDWDRVVQYDPIEDDDATDSSGQRSRIRTRHNREQPAIWRRRGADVYRPSSSSRLRERRRFRHKPLRRNRQRRDISDLNMMV